MERKDEELFFYRLWLHNIPGIGIRTISALKKVFPNEKEIFFAGEDALLQVVKREKARLLTENKDLERAKRISEELDKRKIRTLFPDSPEYPGKLLSLYDPPQILYVRGRLKKESALYNKSIGIVGTRRPDVYGKEMAFYFAKKLAKKKIAVVSGLALGIDGMAHKGALEADGYTVAVLGCGINVTYPKEHIELYERIEEKGAILSEYGLDVPPNAGQFPGRNRLISGLSDGVLVVEAQKRSGSLITADFALEQGRQVYALPGRVGDLCSEGTNHLIRQGAMCVTCPEDILEDLAWMDGNFSLYEERKEEKEADGGEKKKFLAPVEKIVYSCLSLEPMYVDDIITKCRIGVTDAIGTLYLLEEKGLIKQPVKGYYIKSI